MKQYIIRLDDACNRRNIDKWERMEVLLDKYNIQPLVGVIPNCQDESLLIYENDCRFWEKVKEWEVKGWIIALHGYSHVYCSTSGGINPVNNRSEFAGIPLSIQLDKLKKGKEEFRKHNIKTKVFFAPSHTFDNNTLIALKKIGGIQIISDTVASDIYWKNGFVYIPQQCGKCRRLPVRTSTFCFHPNTMTDDDFLQLEDFLSKWSDLFIRPEPDYIISMAKKRRSVYDLILTKSYFAFRKARSAIKRY